jgi:hypothetical protein
LLLTSRLLLVLAAAAPAVGAGLAAADDLQPARQSAATSHARPGAAGDATNITGAIGARGNTGAIGAVAGNARAARAHFNEARVAMEQALLLRDANPKPNITMLEAAMSNLSRELATIERMSQTHSEAAKHAANLAQDWYQDGLKIIKPRPEGLLEVPFPMNIRLKADAVGVALDQVIEEASVRAPAPRPATVAKRRAPAGLERTAKGTVPASSGGWFGAQ